MLAVFTHPFPLVPVIVYVVVIVGLAETVKPVVALNPEAGLHVYVDAPEAERIIFDPLQIVAGLGLTAITGSGLTVTVTVAVLVQPFPSVPVMV
jgi:hypothetical protein